MLKPVETSDLSTLTSTPYATCRLLPQSTLQPMLGVTARVLNAGDEASAQSVLEMLIEVAEVHPRFFRRQLGEVVGAMLQVGACMHALTDFDLGVLIWLGSP